MPSVLSGVCALPFFSAPLFCLIYCDLSELSSWNKESAIQGPWCVAKRGVFHRLRGSVAIVWLSNVILIEKMETVDGAVRETGFAMSWACRRLFKDFH